MRFVVVEIPDNTEAEAFVEAIKNDCILFAKPAGMTTVDGREVQELSWNSPSSEWKVPQVYAVPTLFCECVPQTDWSARSQKYGWWVCAKCAKPHRGAMQHPYNLLEADVDAKHRVYYMGFRADRRPWLLDSEKGSK